MKVNLFIQCNLPGCWSYSLDVMFLLDGSSSINRGEFPLVIEFVKQVVETLDLNTTNVGILQYSHWYNTRCVYLMFHFKSYSYLRVKFLWVKISSH